LFLQPFKSGHEFPLLRAFRAEESSRELESVAELLDLNPKPMTRLLFKGIELSARNLDAAPQFVDAPASELLQRLRGLLPMAPIAGFGPGDKPQHQVAEALGIKRFDDCSISLLTVCFEACSLGVIACQPAKEYVEVSRFAKLCRKPAQLLS
jgi:hypothetical protein